MKKLLLGMTVFAGLPLVGAAQAADLPRPVVKAPPAAVFAPYRCYLGGNIGWARAEVDVNWIANPAGYPISGPAVNASSIATLKDDGIIGGGQIGCNFQSGSLVWGIEGDFQGTSLKANRIVSADTAAFAFTNQQDFDISWLATVRGRLGFTTTPNWSYAPGGFLFYITGGVAFAGVKYSDCELHATTAAFCNTALGTFNQVSVDQTKTGFAVGAGIEGKIAQNWSVKVEYLFVGLPDTTTVSHINTGGTAADITHFHRDLNIQTVRAGLNFHF
jgi:outer membrane immunogenic protein